MLRWPAAARTRTILAAVAALVALAAAVTGLAWLAIRDPDISYLAAEREGRWILYPTPGNSQAHPNVELGAVFRRSFTLDALPSSAHLALEGLRRFRLTVNGQPALSSAATGSWKVVRRADVAGLLRTGENRIEVLVSNHTGPPALWLRLELPGRRLVSDERWDVSWAGATWKKAVPATDPMRGRRFDPSGRMRSPAAALAARWRTVVSLAALCAAVVALGTWLVRRRGAWVRRLLPAPRAFQVALTIACLSWTALFVNNARWLRLDAGFDAAQHLEYVGHVLEKRALPLADQGWQMYQPPLYYVIAAGALRVANLGPLQAGAEIVFRLLGLAFGLANLLLVGAALRLVFPEHPRRQMLGLAVATFLPAPLYLYQLATNETLSLTLSSAVLLLTLRILRAEEPSLRLHAVLGLGMGLALLAKVSTVLLGPVVLGVLLYGLAGRPRGRLPRGLAGIGVFAAITLLVCGWHYGRVWRRFGSPLTGNWDPSTGYGWWQDPGYRTLQDYARFGKSLVAPLFAGFHGVWDGLYATLWGDGLCSGGRALAWAPPWCADLMSAGYLLALIPAVAILLGGVACVAGWVRDPGARGAAVLVLALTAMAGILYMTLRVPSYAQAKAFYGLVGLVPLCAFAARGLDLAMTRRWSSAPALTLLGVWALTAYAALWIHGASPRAQSGLGADALRRGDERRGITLLRDAIVRDPTDWDARLMLVRDMFRRGASLQELERFLDPGGRPATDLADRHVVIAGIMRRTGDLDRALAETNEAVALDPDSPDARMLEGDILAARGDGRGAIAAWREALRIDPHASATHEALGELYARLGAADSAAIHREYARRLRRGEGRFGGDLGGHPGRRQRSRGG